MNSYFKEYLCGMIRQQQAFGYKYESQISMLIAFDRFMCERYPDQNELTKEIAEAWVEENGIYGTHVPIVSEIDEKFVYKLEPNMLINTQEFSKKDFCPISEKAAHGKTLCRYIKRKW